MLQDKKRCLNRSIRSPKIFIYSVIGWIAMELWRNDCTFRPQNVFALYQQEGPRRRFLSRGSPPASGCEYPRAIRRRRPCAPIARPLSNERPRLSGPHGSDLSRRSAGGSRWSSFPTGMPRRLHVRPRVRQCPPLRWRSWLGPLPRSHSDPQNDHNAKSRAHRVRPCVFFQFPEDFPVQACLKMPTQLRIGLPEQKSGASCNPARPPPLPRNASIVLV